MSQTNLVANTYNPHNQSPQELIDGFVIRKKEFESLYNDIKSDTMQHPPQHVIIQGRRGSGKTSFLLRIYHEVLRDVSVNTWLLPLIFNEEQYSVRTLYKLWEHVATELENSHTGFLNLPDAMEVDVEAVDYEERCFEMLIAALQQQKKKLLLLIDNFGDMLQKFSEKEQHRLREVLITCTDMKIVGASSVALESTFEYDKPFFDYFRIINLDGLSKEETTTLLRSLGDKHHKEQINKIIEKSPGRIEALRRLTDGVPRTMILLFEIFVDDVAGDSFRNLEMVLDRVTPLYKHRMDDLPAQQQEIVDIIALNWDAIPVKEIARKSHLESKAVSAQLRLLEKNKIVIKKPTSTKNHLYQVSERFFNIWYLMRNGRKKDRNQVQWLTRFLEEWCSREELVERARGHLDGLKNGTVCEPCAFYMTEALARTFIPLELQDSLIKETRNFLSKIDSSFYSQLSNSDIELFEKAEHLCNNKQYSLAIQHLKGLQSQLPVINRMLGHCYFELDEMLECEQYFTKAIQQGSVSAILDLACVYNLKNKNENAIQYYNMAIEKGNSDAMVLLANLYLINNINLDLTEELYRKAEVKGNTNAILQLAFFYQLRKNDPEKAGIYWKKARANEDPIALVKIASDYYCKGINKDEALRHVNHAWALGLPSSSKILYPLILLWNNEIERSNSVATQLFQKPEMANIDLFVGQYLLLLIAKHQYNFAYKLFRESPLNLRERYRPIYYALMFFMQDTYPDEYRKMGSELEETVNEIIEEIKVLEKTR